MKRVLKVISILLSILLIMGGYCFLNYRFNFSVPCIFHKITGLYCPGCGITRMLFSIIRLDFYQAFRYNPLVFIMLLLYILYKFLSSVVELCFKRKIKIPKHIYYIILIIVILFGIVRNLPVPVFEYLKPTAL